ncbi:MAG: GTP-binding protein, partial [Steroidobacteraceae bacterium]
DLPGYGYAEGPRAHREDWARLIEALAPRRSLKGLLLVVDARRGVQDSDEQLLAWAQLHERPVHVLLSKADQLRRSEARQLLASAQTQLASRAAVQLFSARDGTGIDEARARLQSWLAQAGQEKAPAVR